MLSGLHSNLSAAETIRISKTTDSMPPYYWKDGNKTVGILPDILTSLDGYDHDFVLIARSRLDHLFRNGELDVAILHPKYTKADDDLHFIPLNISQKTILITNTENRQPDVPLNAIQDTTICARKGYVYINMEKRWADQSLTRIDLNSHASVVNLVHKNVCKYGIISRLILKYEIKRQHIKNVVGTKHILSNVPRYLAVTKQKTKLYHRLNAHIEKLIETGELEHIIQRHAPH